MLDPVCQEHAIARHDEGARDRVESDGGEGPKVAKQWIQSGPSYWQPDAAKGWSANQNGITMHNWRLPLRHPGVGAG